MPAETYSLAREKIGETQKNVVDMKAFECVRVVQIYTHNAQNFKYSLLYLTDVTCVC